MRNTHVMLTALVLATVLSGCGNQAVQTNIQQALVVDDKLQVVFNNLAVAAAASIPTLPPDKQADARQTLADLQERADAGFQAKEDALQAALLASQQTVDIAALSGAIVTVVEDLWRFCSLLGVSPRLLARARVSLDGHKAAVARGKYRGR